MSSYKINLIASIILMIISANVFAVEASPLGIITGYYTGWGGDSVRVTIKWGQSKFTLTPSMKHNMSQTNNSNSAMMTLIDSTKNWLLFLVGVTLTAITINTIYVIRGISIDYFAGVDPYHSFLSVPVIIAIESFVGYVIILALDLLRIKRIEKPLKYLKFGAVLGLAKSGSVVFLWVGWEYVELSMLSIVLVFALWTALDKPITKP